MFSYGDALKVSTSLIKCLAAGSQHEEMPIKPGVLSKNFRVYHLYVN